MNNLISAVVASSRVSWATSWKDNVSDNISLLLMHCSRMILLSETDGYERRRKRSDQILWWCGWICRNEKADFNGKRSVLLVIGRGYELPWSLLDEKKGEISSLEAPDRSPECGRRITRLWAASRLLEAMDTSHRLRFDCRTTCLHQATSDAKQHVGTALLTYRSFGSAIFMGWEKQRVRLTEVA